MLGHRHYHRTRCARADIAVAWPPIDRRPLSLTAAYPGRDGLPQGDDRDLTARVEAQGNVTDAKASAGIADHVSLSPGAHAGMPASQQMSDDRPAAREAYLPAMGVATKVKRVSRSCCVIRHFRRMHQRNSKPFGRL